MKEHFHYILLCYFEAFLQYSPSPFLSTMPLSAQQFQMKQFSFLCLTGEEFFIQIFFLDSFECILLVTMYEKYCLPSSKDCSVFIPCVETCQWHGMRHKTSFFLYVPFLHHPYYFPNPDLKKLPLTMVQLRVLKEKNF